MALEEAPGLTDEFYIPATSPRLETRVLKHGDTFAIFDITGDIRPVGLHEHGIYYAGTRFLSRFQLRLGSERPLLLSSTVKEDNVMMAVDLTNPDVLRDERVLIPRGTLHISRSIFLWQGVCYERLLLRNYGLLPVDAMLNFLFATDFADMFEVRGIRRAQRGENLPEQTTADGIVLAYRGLDGQVRRTRLTCSPPPSDISPTRLHLRTELLPQEETKFFLTISCEMDRQTPQRLTFESAAQQAERALRARKDRDCEVRTSNEQLDEWLTRSASDLRMMMTETPEGPYPYAGVPWFSTPFGRDGIIVALEYLWVNPDMARAVLQYLAARQATEFDPKRDAEPGKILHETRDGEMAALGEIPFGRYYGSVDSTPLFVALAGAYYERTGDRAFIERLWPHVERALEWMDRYGDLDGDGFLEYKPQSAQSLSNQGWKDSQDAVFHADGTLAESPIALCEVQGYAFAAKRRAAQLAAALGRLERAQQLLDEARSLQERFDEAFWCEDLSTYALALDGTKKPCLVRTSNPGHCLWTGIASPEHARRVAETLMGEHSYSGWGVRTVAEGEARYNPMSYHNGSVWPHDNAIIARGFARYGFKEQCLRILEGLFEASTHMDLHRLPELFCGFDRRPGEAPTLYPVACSPQAWAAGSVFLLLQACLGLSISVPENQISFSYPALPQALAEVEIRNLQVGDASLDLSIRRYADDVAINVVRRTGDVEILIVK